MSTSPVASGGPTVMRDTWSLPAVTTSSSPGQKNGGS
ncbi:hypothetical protein NC653_008050 [Populus alba x Populus x berolinensis]|uniref:Uncharacterized protein n=1 Tax=Populus alba x Populus x berolinensis TaxID=444605 RepID=A0AAD6W808_9ROSI|nr:hypothetical protein NC653_008050 [Populus alba x Populus x berolinensis]